MAAPNTQIPRFLCGLHADHMNLRVYPVLRHRSATALSVQGRLRGSGALCMVEQLADARLRHGHGQRHPCRRRALRPDLLPRCRPCKCHHIRCLGTKVGQEPLLVAPQDLGKGSGSATNPAATSSIWPCCRAFALAKPLRSRLSGKSAHRRALVLR